MRPGIRLDYPVVGSEFSAVLARLRSKRGFKTPYAFFSRNGGPRGLGMTYGAYWKIEKGRLLPKGERLAVLLTCLGLSPASPEARELLRAYLKAMLGSDQVLDWVVSAFGPESSPPQRSTEDKALQRLVHENVYRLTPRQNHAIIADYASYWAYEILTTDQGSRAVADLAKELGVTLALMRASLRRLSSLRIVRLAPDGTVSSPLAGRHIHTLPEGSLSAAERQRIREFQERLVKTRASLVSRAYIVARAEAVELASYAPHLRKTVCEFLAHSSPDKTRTSALFLIEGNAYRLLP